MKFVHLASRDAVSRIKRSGIAMGRGYAGAGVYCVPRIMLPLAPTTRLREGAEPSASNAILVSTGDHWKWLFRPGNTHGNARRPVAVTFWVPKHLWPVEVTLFLSRDQWTRFLDGDGKRGYALRSIDREDVPMPYSRRSVTIFAASPDGVGAALAFFRGSGGFLSSGEEFEAVVRGPIPPSCITRVDALSQTNREFATKRRNRIR